jgi:D-alanyl-D-alanine-carboxypeptidase/D-alanyl-D-alanine-endopeptidase
MRMLRAVVAAALVGPAGLSVASPANVAALIAPPNGEIQQLLDARTRIDPGTGIVVGIIDHGRTTILKSGSSGTSRPLDEHSLFEIGSVTKTFTATLLADMVLHHEVNLTDPVGQFFQPKDPKDPYADYTWEKLSEFLNSYALPRDPGDQFEYSNLGASVLGDALADEARTSYPALLQSRIFNSLGMTESSALTISALPPSLFERMTTGHGLDDEVTPAWNLDAMAPAGAIRSSVADMLRYVRCNLGLGPLAEACLFAQQPRDTLPGNQIGLIWWTGDYVPIIRHGGDTAGYHACVAISPDRQRGVVVLANGGSSVGPLAEELIDASLAIPQLPAFVTLAPSDLDAYAGTYHAIDTRNRNRVVRDGDGLTMQVDGIPGTLRIYALGNDRFSLRTLPADLTFTRDSGGAINALRVRFLGRTTTYVRDGMRPPPEAVTTPAPSFTLDPKILTQYIGTYVAGADVAFTVAAGGESGLTVQLMGQPAFSLYASAQDHFYLKVVDAQIEFTRDDAGRVVKIINHQNGQLFSATRR